jgi:hypothetical protein
MVIPTTNLGCSSALQLRNAPDSNNPTNSLLKNDFICIP